MPGEIRRAPGQRGNHDHETHGARVPTSVVAARLSSFANTTPQRAQSTAPGITPAPHFGQSVIRRESYSRTRTDHFAPQRGRGVQPRGEEVLPIDRTHGNGPLRDRIEE